MDTTVFDFNDYKKYLSVRLPTRGEFRGVRSRLAQKLRCQGAYISQVLNGVTNFSLEHAALIDEYLNHTVEESQYFMLLVHYGRAGSKILEKYYLKQMEFIQKRRELIGERIHVEKTLPKDAALHYYNHWYFCAIHILITIPKYQTSQAIAKCLGLPLSLVSEALHFLVSVGLATESKGKFQPGATRIHLGADSPMIAKHHSNWRMRSMHSLEQPHREDLHYSGAIGISLANAVKIKAILLSTIEKLEPILAEPNEEEAFCLGIDFFQLSVDQERVL